MKIGEVTRTNISTKGGDTMPIKKKKAAKRRAERLLQSVKLLQRKRLLQSVKLQRSLQSVKLRSANSF